MLCSLFTLTGCRIEPPLNLPEDGRDIETSWPEVELALDILWEYNLRIDSVTMEIIDSTYNWRDDFYYGWDDTDNRIFGTWTLTKPTIFNIRRYYTGDEPYGTHTSVNKHQIEGTTLSAHYQFGYYDVLAWNEVTTLDGVQSLHFDESTTLDYVTCYTNQSMNRAMYSPRHQYAYYQPEFLFGGYAQAIYISHNYEDYDYYNEETHTYYKKVDMVLDPRTYIYLTQVILHHNNGRIAGIDGVAALQGMSRTTNLNTGVTGDDEIAVTFSQRMKQNVDKKGENVDIIGGRLFTFGLCGLNPSRASRATARSTGVRNYLNFNVTFNNGIDSTFVFDVTDQVQKRYKGGILTVELDMDTVPIPSRSGGSGFDAVVADYDSATYEFDMVPQKPKRVNEANKANKAHKPNEAHKPNQPNRPN